MVFAMALCFFFDVRHDQAITSASNWSVSRGSPRKRDRGFGKSRSLGGSCAPGPIIWWSWMTTIARSSNSRSRTRGRTTLLGARRRIPLLPRGRRSPASLERFCSLRLLRQSCRSLQKRFLQGRRAIGSGARPRQQVRG